MEVEGIVYRGGVDRLTIVIAENEYKHRLQPE